MGGRQQVVQSGRGRPMGLHVRRSDRDELVRGEGHVRGVGGVLLGREVVGDHVREGLGEVLQRREQVGHEARMGQPHCLLRESRWAGPGLRALGLVVEREGHGGHDLDVFHHGVGRAGKATEPKGCRSIHLFRRRGCHRRQGG